MVSAVGTTDLKLAIKSQISMKKGLDTQSCFFYWSPNKENQDNNDNHDNTFIEP